MLARTADSTVIAVNGSNAASTPATRSRLLQQGDLARGRVEIGAHAVEHVVDRRRGAMTVISEVISDYVRGDLAKDPSPSGEHRHKLGKVAISGHEIQELVVTMVRRDELNGAQDVIRG